MCCLFACSLQVVFEGGGISDIDTISLRRRRLKRHGGLAASKKEFVVGEKRE